MAATLVSPVVPSPVSIPTPHAVPADVLSTAGQAVNGSPLVDPAVRRFAAGLVRFTSDDVPVLVRAGILPDDSTIELLDGLLVYRDCGDAKGGPGVASIGHDYVVRMIGKLDRGIDRPDRHVVTQLTLELSGSYSPIPDAMVLRGPPTDYQARRPLPADALSVIEVSDTSYGRDAGDKLAAYARAGIPQYVIVVLGTRTAEVYADPDPTTGTYRTSVVVSEAGSVALRVGSDEAFSIRLSEVLPLA